MLNAGCANTTVRSTGTVATWQDCYRDRTTGAARHMTRKAEFPVFIHLNSLRRPPEEHTSH